MERRSFLKKAAAGGLAAGSIAAPAIVHAQPKLQWRLAASWTKSLDTLFGGADLVVVVGTLGLYFAVRAKLDSIGKIAAADSKNRPPKFNDAINLLLLGSDSRSGHNKVIGGKIGCNCSDTIMLAHISPGGAGITVLSIPRDTMVPYYACTATQGSPGQQADPSAFERINQTLAAGGPECVRETVEQQTGIHVDNIIQLDFTGFQKVINDVHGVTVCVPTAINDPIRALPDGDIVGSGLKLPAGRHHITGRVALKFWRARYALADGSDLARIQRDQYLMGQIVKGVLRSGMLVHPTTLYRVVGDVASSMSTDASISDLVKIARSLGSLSSTKVNFVTAPTGPYPGDPGAELSLAPTAGAIFTAIARDKTLPKAPRKKGTKDKGKQHGSGGQLATISPSKVDVTVLNGTTTAGLAAKVSTELSAAGFALTGIPGNAASSSYVQTQIGYGAAADLAAARTLRQYFPHALLKQVPGLAAGTVQLIVGPGFTTVAQPNQPIGTISGSFNASARCRNGAFFGPNLPAPTGKVACAC